MRSVRPGNGSISCLWHPPSNDNSIELWIRLKYVGSDGLLRSGKCTVLVSTNVRCDQITPLSTHWGRDKMDAISQTTFSIAFSWMRMFEFRLRLLKFVPKGPINDIPALVQIMAWRRLGDKPLSESMMVSLPTHVCVTRPQWVKKKKKTKAMIIAIDRLPG